MIDITACIATFNRSNLLDNCISSVLANNVPPNCIHVIDNSTSSAHLYINRMIASSYDVLYLHSPEPGNLSAARNLSISNTDTIFWTFLDDDDRWPTNYLGSIDILMDTIDSSVILTYGKLYHNSFYRFDQIDSLYSAFLWGLTPPVGMQIYNLRHLCPSVRYSESITSGVDHDLWISLLESNPSLYINPLPLDITSVSSPSRITQSYLHRKRNINRSLESWRDTLICHCGTSFFMHFRHCYQISLEDLLYSQILIGRWYLLLYFNLYNFLTFIVRRLFIRPVNKWRMFAPYNLS